VSGGLVSVVIPFFESAAYLAEAIESVLGQTYRRHELILVDDGSTDDGPAVAERFATRATLVRQANLGVGPARNAGLALATGDLIAFLDADDLWAPTKLERQVAALQADAGLDGVMTMVEEFLSPELDPATAPLRPVPGARPGAIPSALMVRRSAMDRVGRFNDSQAGQWADWYGRFVDAGLRAATLPQVLVRRRLHMTNLGYVHRAERGVVLHALKASLDRRRQGLS
jgi:glycosyltransferase involved in cell wall biosynthesis